MAHTIITGLLWFSAISCGILGGVYFAFSAFIMNALGRIEARTGIAAMNAINSAIVRSPFLPLFLGSSLACLVLACVAPFHWQQSGSPAVFAGGGIYILGMFVCTMVFNVPLNNTLASADPASADSADIWCRYLRDWTFWNHVRTFASVAATILFTYAITVQS